MKLLDEDFKFLLSTRSSVLPIRIGSKLLLEPYYLNRFARQFGFDQSVPANNLSFAASFRQQRSIMELAQTVATLYRCDTGAKFFSPNVYFEGLCTWSYYNWWVRSSTPYLSQSMQKIHQITVTDKAILREQVFIIDHLHPNPKSVSGPVRISEMVGNKSPRAKSTKVSPKGKSYGGSFKGQSISVSVKGKSAGASSKKGKEKVFTAEHKSQMQKRSFREWSPSNINFKRVHHDCPDHSDDSDAGNDIGFKDLPMPNFQEKTLYPQDISILESIDAYEMTTTSIRKEKQDSLLTAIIPRQVTLDDVVEATPLQSVPTEIRSLFVNSKEDWVQESILSGMETIMGMISNQDSSRALLANKTRVFRSLKILHSMVENSQLSTVEISWLTSKIEETFNAVEIVGKIQELVDTERLNLLSSRDSIYSSEIAQLEGKLKELSVEVLKLELTEKEILKEEERIHKMRKDFLDTNRDYLL